MGHGIGLCNNKLADKGCGAIMLTPENIKAMNEDFAKRLNGMLDLVARGRGIEILIRIADQTRDGLAAVSKSYESMMASKKAR